MAILLKRKAINMKGTGLIIVKFFIIGGIICSLFKINCFRQIFFKDTSEFETKNYIALISLFGSIGIIGSYLFDINGIYGSISIIFLNLAGIFTVILIIDKLYQVEVEDVKGQKRNNLNKSLKNLNFLCELTQKVVDSRINLYQTLELIVDMTCEILEVEAGGIIILDDDKEQISYKAVNNIELDFISEKISEDILEVISDEQELIVNNSLRLDKKFGFIKESGYNGLLVVPLIENDEEQDEIHGILFTASKTGVQQQDLKMMNTLATQAVYLIKGNRLFERMQKNVAELSTLQMISTTINSTLDLDQVLELAIDVIVGTMGVSSCAVLLFDENREELSLEASRGWPDKFDKKEVFNMESDFFNKIIESQEIVVFNEVPDKVKEELSFLEMKSAIAVPLKLRDDVIGIITAVNTMISYSFNGDDERFLTTLANQIAIAIENARIYNQMEEQAIKDGLTQLYNHSYFQHALSEEIDRAERYQQDLSLLLLDIDNFKEINDTYGHPVGDKVLEELSTILKRITRKIDIAARYGGEEFAIILPETDIEGAKLLGNRINDQVREMVIEEEGLELKITVSIGAAAYNKEITQKDLINNADQALYRAKTEGKDKVCIS